MIPVSQCSLCEQWQSFIPPRQCPTHANEYGIVLANDLLALTADEAHEFINRLRTHRAEAGPTRQRARATTHASALAVLDLNSITAGQAAIAVARGQLTVEDVLQMVAAGKFSLEELQRALG